MRRGTVSTVTLALGFLLLVGCGSATPGHVTRPSTGPGGGPSGANGSDALAACYQPTWSGQSTDQSQVAARLLTAVLRCQSAADIPSSARLSGFRINAVQVATHTQSGFVAMITFSIKPAVPTAYVLAGNGKPLNAQGWIMDKLFFETVTRQGDTYRATQFATSP